jgi:hypothetical protein
VKQLLENNDKGHVVATCRNPNASTGLLHLKDRFDDRLQVLPLDLTVESSIEVMLLFPLIVLLSCFVNFAYSNHDFRHQMTLLIIRMLGLRIDFLSNIKLVVYLV